MRNSLKLTLLVLILGSIARATAQNALPTSDTARTPHVYQRSAIPGTAAPPLPAPAPKALANAPATNGPVAAPARQLVSTLKREVQIIDGGARATWGRTKCYFPADLSGVVRVTTPDGRHVSFRPTFLVLENRATQETVLLGTVTNRDVGTVYASANSVVWTNIFDAGPKVSLELKYDGFTGKLEQNILLQESLDSLPGGWSASDVVLECWTAWWQDSGPPPAIQSKTISIRPATATNGPVAATDATVSFGASRITAGGRAFTVASDAQPLPVSKAWITPDAPNTSSPGTNQPSYLIEAVDLLSAQAQTQALPKPVRQSSIQPKKRSRSELARIQPFLSQPPVRNAKTVSRRMLVAQSQSLPSTGDVRGGSQIPGVRTALSAQTNSAAPARRTRLSALPGGFLAARGTPPLVSRTPAFCIDFSLSEAVSLPANAISWWPAGSNALDALPNHNDGTEYSLGYTAGEVGQGFSLDGTNAHARVPDSPSLHVTNALTIEAWVNPASYDSPGFRDIVGKWDLEGDPPQKSYDLSLAPDSTAYLILSSDGDDTGAQFVVTTNVVPSDTWTHIAGVYDGTAIRMYFNGEPDAAGAYSSGIFPGTNDLGLGGFVGGGAPGDVGSPFRGALDEQTLYSRALSAAEIQAIYNAGPAGKFNPDCTPCPSNAVAWWPGDGNAFDIAHTNMGVMLNDATLVSGVVGQGFGLNGTGAHVRVPDNPDFHCTNAMTLEAWVYPTDTDNYHCVIDKWDYFYGAGQKSYDLSIGPGGQPYFLVSSDGFDSGNAQVTADDPIPANSWTHLAGVYDGSTLSLYTNGVLAQQVEYSGGIYPGTNDLAIGALCGGAPYGQALSINLFAGVIDEPAIYDRALTDTEISAIYTAGCAGKCKNWEPGDLFTDLQYQFLGLSGSDDDSDGVNSGIEFFQGRNPHIAGTVADTNNLINLQVYTPLK